MYSCHLFLISSTCVRSIPFLSFAYLCMKYFLCISDFLEVISSLSHSIVFLYFFTLFTSKGFPMSPCYSLEFCIQMSISFCPLPLLWSLWNYPLQKQTVPHFEAKLTLCNAHILSVECFSLNKPLLTCPFVSNWILSAMRNWEHEFH